MPPSAESVAKRLHYVHQEGAAVYKFAVARMADVAVELMERNRLTNDMVDWLVPHQANKRIIEATAERLKLPPERVMVTIHKYGNTTAATIPLCLWEYEEKLKDRRPPAAGGLRRRLHLGGHLSPLGLSGHADAAMRVTSAARSACSHAGRHRYRAGAGDRSSGRDPRSFPSTARSSPRCAPPRTAR